MSLCTVVAEPILSRLGSSHSDARSLAAGRVLASHSSILALTSSGHSVISLHHSGVGDAAQRETSFASGNACSPVACRDADDLAVITRAQLRLPKKQKANGKHCNAKANGNVNLG